MSHPQTLFYIISRVLSESATEFITETNAIVQAGGDKALCFPSALKAVEIHGLFSALNPEECFIIHSNYTIPFGEVKSVNKSRNITHKLQDLASREIAWVKEG